MIDIADGGDTCYRPHIATYGGYAMHLKIKEVDGMLHVVGEFDDGSFCVVDNVPAENIHIYGLGVGYWKAEIKFLFRQVNSK